MTSSSFSGGGEGPIFDNESKGPRFRNDGVGCRSFEGFNNGVEEGGCYVHNDNPFGGSSFLLREFDRYNHGLLGEFLWKNIYVLEGLEDRRRIDGKWSSAVGVKVARSLEDLDMDGDVGKRVPAIRA